MKSYAILPLALMIFLAGCTSSQSTPESGGSQVIGGANVIEITSSGFSPNQLSMELGEKVTFVNRDAEEHWPASAVHPTHRVYPGSGIEKCGTDEEKTIFDACRGLKQGEAFEFTFNEEGRWCYHDHKKSSLFGCIEVK